jgi:hypothetical protein
MAEGTLKEERERDSFLEVKNVLHQLGNGFGGFGSFVVVELSETNVFLRLETFSGSKKVLSLTFRPCQPTSQSCWQCCKIF